MSEVQREAAATVAARRDLGDGYDDVLAAGLVERIDAEIDRRVAERVARARPAAPAPRVGFGELALAGGSFATAFLVTVYALNAEAAYLAVVVWIVVAVVNVVPWVVRRPR